MNRVVDIKTKMAVEHLPFVRVYARELMDYLFNYKRDERELTQGEEEMLMDLIDYLENNSGANAHGLDQLLEETEGLDEGA